MPKHQQYCQICMKGARGYRMIYLWEQERSSDFIHGPSVYENGCGFPTMGDEKIEMETRTKKKNNLNNDPFFRLKYAMFYIDHSEKLSYSFICKPFIRILIFFESAIHMVILCYIRTILIASINTSKKNLVTVVLVYCCRIWSLYYKVWLFFVPN